MASPNGLATIGAPGTATGFLNTPEYQRTAVHEMRLASIFGRQGVSALVRAEDSSSRGVDPSKTAAVSVQTLEKGSEVRWHMEMALKGAPTFGDRVPAKGGYLSFRHQKSYLNLLKAPAFQVKGEFEQMKQDSTIDGKDAERIRRQLVAWNGHFYGHDHIIAFLKGATDNLLQPVSNGGSNVDLGRGAGVQVSPINAMVRGTGIIGGATLAAREANIKSALSGLSVSNAKHLLSIEMLQNVSEEMSAVSGKFQGIGQGGEEIFYCILPTIARIDLLGAASSTTELVKYSLNLEPNSPLFQFRPIKVGRLVVLFDDLLAKYAPDISGPEIVWGKDTYEAQTWDWKDLPTAQKQRGIGLVLGASSLLFAQAKSMRFTEEKGPHGVGHEISTMMYRSGVRSMFVDMQDSSVLPIDQSSMLLAFAMKGPTHGT